MNTPPPPRRPSTRTLTRVLEWLATQNLSVYGPCVDFKAGVQTGACMDYDVEQILKLAKLNKRYPEGIPRGDDDDD